MGTVLWLSDLCPATNVGPQAWDTQGPWLDWMLGSSLQSVVEPLETCSLISLGKPIGWDFIPPGHHDPGRTVSKKRQMWIPILAFKIIIKCISRIERSVEYKVGLWGEGVTIPLPPKSYFYVLFISIQTLTEHIPPKITLTVWNFKCVPYLLYRHWYHTCFRLQYEVITTISQ